AATLRLPLISLLAGFLPYAGANACRSIAAYEAERLLPHRVWTRAEYVVFQLRVLALPAVPILLLHGIQDAILLIPAVRLVVLAYETLLMTIGILILIPIVFGLSPLLVRWVLGAKPLEPG